MGEDLTDSVSSEGTWIPTAELADLRERLREAQETLDAIRSGEVDAVVVNGENGNQVYSLTGADQPYRVYVEQMQEGAVTVAGDGLILYGNQRFADMAGLPLGKVISASLQNFLGPLAWKKISRVLTTGHKPSKDEGVLRQADGGELPVHFTASPLPLPDQQVICLIVTDLSEQKNQESLRLAKEVAERANLAKDSFLATLSHELRTPLTPALMAISGLQHHKDLPDAVQGDLAMIRRNIELETRLIDDLLDLTRIANGKLELHEGPLDIHLVLQRAVDICRPGIAARQQQLHLRMEAANTQGIGDAVRIQQVMWNLVRNANKFTPNGGVITIETRNTDHCLVVDVRDTGIGFVPETAPRLFEAFEQIGRDITRQFGGLGLGLAISRSIVIAHGGKIHGESPGPGKGATFTVELPISPVIASGSSFGASSPASEAAKGLRILLVEDHDDTRIITQKILEFSGHTISPARSAQEAWDLAAASTFDLVISDLGLPDKSGLEMMRLLRDKFSLRGIAMSGYGMEEDIERSREAGFAHHITKPAHPSKLVDLVNQMGR